MAIEIIHEVGEYYVGIESGRVFVARNCANGCGADVHGSFPDAPSNRDRCIGYANRQARRESAKKSEVLS